VVASSDVSRNQDGIGWLPKAVALSGAATVGGAAAGAALGLLGGMLAAPARAAAAVALAALAVLVVLLRMAGVRVPVLQRDRETPQRWMHAGPLGWATRNGLALGIGATSRIGFWLWYVVPVTALLSASPRSGAALYGLYSALRTGGVWVLLLAPAAVWRGRNGDWPIWARGIATARFAADLCLLLVGAAVLVARLG
jgi:hypothetical protein